MTAERQVGVVFIHGFKSSPSVWNPFLRLIAQDPKLAFAKPLAFGYSTGLWSFSALRNMPTFDTVADSLKEFLVSEGERYSRLMLVTHSQGGLVAQRYLSRMLTEGKGKDLQRIRGVVMFACPNSGSQLGLSIRRWFLRSNPQEQQLRPFSEQITDTHRTILADIVGAKEVTARTCPIPFHVYTGETDGVVSRASAQSVFREAAVLPGDHFTIVRPDSHSHRTYVSLKRHILLAATDTSSPPANSSGETEGFTSGQVPDAVIRAAEAEKRAIILRAMGEAKAAAIRAEGDANAWRTRKEAYDALKDPEDFHRDA